jgi:epoxyqueuosine reductase
MRVNDPLLKARIFKEAFELGFDLAGVSSIQPLLHYDYYLRSLSEGRHGTMNYLRHQAPKRQNPKLVFPGAESLLVLGMNYFTPHTHSSSPLKGRISRYALGEDYHVVVKKQLGKLLHFIREQKTAADGLCYVDTGSVMEKAWGAATNLGWMGKHTNLISKHLGSWFFLGVILLNFPLEPDVPAKNYCGTCRRCMDACPTGAITAPYVLDSRLCISYLTIEHRGTIPRILRSLIGNRIFGCDLCQEACPWNRFSRETRETSFFARRECLMPDLIPLVRITQSEFKERFQKSPIYRATRNGFVRNVVIALGNSGEVEAIPALESALTDESAVVRASAAWALSKVSPESARRILPVIRKREQDPMVLQEIGEFI